MIHDYDKPNICYAIGDSFAVLLGNAATNRQPASGVFEEISSIITGGTTDPAQFYDGTNSQQILNGVARTDINQGNSGAVRFVPYNMAIKIGNAVYYRKNGTTDRHGVCGVQVDA
jgi:hypothetical protein